MFYKKDHNPHPSWLLKKTNKNEWPAAILKEGIRGCGGVENDVKCSICQEDYIIGDEIGRLECEHGYHVGCIQHWLRQKNWCPICKSSAVGGTGY